MKKQKDIAYLEGVAKSITFPAYDTKFQKFDAMLRQVIKANIDPEYDPRITYVEGEPSIGEPGCFVVTVFATVTLPEGIGVTNLSQGSHDFSIDPMAPLGAQIGEINDKLTRLKAWSAMNQRDRSVRKIMEERDALLANK